MSHARTKRMRQMARKVTISARDTHDATQAMKRGWKQGVIKSAGLCFVTPPRRRKPPTHGVRPLKPSGPVHLERPVYELSKIYGRFFEEQNKAYTPKLSHYLERQRNLCLALARRAHRIPKVDLDNQVRVLMRRAGVNV